MNDKREIIILQVFNDSVNAQFAKSKLEENGIESFLEEENIVGINPLGGVELKIFADDLIKAQEIIST